MKLVKKGRELGTLATHGGASAEEQGDGIDSAEKRCLALEKGGFPIVSNLARQTHFR